MKRSAINRKKPLLRSSRLRAVGKKRKGDGWARVKAAWLAAHPYCMATIAICGVKESEVISYAGHVISPEGVMFRIKPAEDVHHRNKSRGARRTDTRWLLSVTRDSHDFIEARKLWARSVGLLLPLEADKDGNLPDGSACLTTPEFMAAMVGKGFALPT